MPAEPHSRVAVQGHAAAGVGARVRPPRGDEDAADRLAGLERSARELDEVNVDGLLGRTALDFGDGERARTGEQVFGVELVRLRGDRLSEVEQITISISTTRSVVGIPAVAVS
jgi:hypothetical protein